MSITCDLCEKPFAYKREQRGTKETCPSCMANRHRWSMKAVMVKYKGGKCQLCGYDKKLRSMDFHHVDPLTKTMGFATNHNRSWESIRVELDKCVCLCRNCHGEVEDALEMVEWGQSPDPIIERVNQIHNAFKPSPVAFSRTCWQEHHPKFSTPAVRP